MVEDIACDVFACLQCDFPILSMFMCILLYHELYHTFMCVCVYIDTYVKCELV